MTCSAGSRPAWSAGRSCLSSQAPGARRVVGSRRGRAGSARGRRTLQRAVERLVRRPRQRLRAAAPALPEGDPDRHPLRRVVPLAAAGGEHPAADLERRPRAVGADRRGRHRPQPEVLGHQVHLEVAQHARVDQDGRGVLVWDALHGGTLARRAVPSRPVAGRIKGCGGPRRWRRPWWRPFSRSRRRRAGRAGRCRTTPARAVARAAKAPRLVVDLKKGRHRISPLIYGVNFADKGFAKVRRPAGQPLGRQQHRDLQLADPRQQPRAGLVLHQLRGLLVRGVRLLPARPGLQRRGCAGAAGPSHEDRDAADAAAAGVGRQRGVVRRQPPVQLPRVVQPAGRPRPVPLDLRQRAAQRAVADRRPGHGRRAGRTGVLGAVDRCAEGEVRRRAARRRLDLRSSATSRTLWDDTHHGFHPQPTTYDELWTKSRDLALAVKDADPGAATLGPAEWGWPNYFCSAADNVDQGCFPTSPDRAAHGGTELSSWYLAAVRGLRSSRPAAGCSTTSTCTTTRRASTPPSPT